MQSFGQQELDEKRKVCPRLYFLSNDELIQLLSDPSSLNSMMDKIFTVNGTFEMAGSDIVGMNDGDGDSLKFDAPVPMGAIPETINAVIDAMRKAVRREIESAMQVQGGVADLLASNHIHQAIELVDLIRTTQETEDTMSLGLDALKARFAKLNAKLDELSNETKKDHSVSKAKTLQALIALNANHRDFIKKHMLEHCNDQAWPLHFQKWEMLHRYYWQDGVVIKVDVYELGYGYEYLGSYNRLVMTELSRCTYVELARGLVQGTGVAASGPAGTGKTETAKDFFRHLGQYAVVFNCSDQLNNEIMAKFMMGAEGTGCAVLFDEFNITPKEVIDASLEGLNKYLSRKQVAVYLSMNPGHAKRQQLCKKYWETFSRMTFTLPDREKICQVHFFNHGFGAASDELGKLYNVSMKTFESDLSRQRHYDFGLRAMIATWKRAGSLIKKGLSPADALVTALYQHTFSGLSNADKPIFEGILKANFPDAYVVVENSDFAAKFAAAQPDASDYTKVKAEQIYSKSTMRHGLMVLGGECKIVEDVVGVIGGSCTILETPDSEGDFFEKTLWEALAQAQDKSDHWIVIKDKNNAWFNNSTPMNKLTDDNKVLFSKSGDRMKLPQSCRIVLLTQHANDMGPAMVSRFGVINMME